MYKSILIAIDGSDYSMRATEEALHLIDETSEVTLLTVVNEVSIEVNPLDNASPKDTLTFYKQSLTSFADILYPTGCRIITYAIEGNPQEQVVKWANSGQYDVIVMGTQGSRPIHNRLLGSVSQSVIF